MAPPVVRVSSDQLDELAAMFAHAFADEPVLRAMFPDPRRRAAIAPPWGAVSLHLSYLDGKAMETTPAGNCVIIWIRPGQVTSWQSYVRAAPYLWQMLRRASPGDVRRFLAYFTRFETRRHDLLPEPHWFLEALAVDPQRQRFGLGAVLVRHGLARADADHVPAYVETDTERNAAFYSKLDFELVEYVEDYPPMNIPTWRMVHRPA